MELVHNPAHKRSPFFQLTQRGKEALKIMSQNERSWVDGLLPQMAKAEVASALKLLSQIQRLLAEKGQPSRPQFVHGDQVIMDESKSIEIQAIVKSEAKQIPAYTDLPVNLL